jgi:hypothetical protein
MASDVQILAEMTGDFFFQKRMKGTHQLTRGLLPRATLATFFTIGIESSNSSRLPSSPP